MIDANAGFQIIIWKCQDPRDCDRRLVAQIEQICVTTYFGRCCQLGYLARQGPEPQISAEGTDSCVEMWAGKGKLSTKCALA